MRSLHAILTVIAVTSLVACGGPTEETAPAPSGDPIDITVTTTRVEVADTDGSGDPGDDQPADEPERPAEPDLDRVSVDIEIVAVLDRPVDLAVRPGDTGVHIVEQVGRIWRIDGSQSMMIADLSDLTAASGERGLLGLAFSIDGARAYVNHTDLGGDTVVAEYRIAADGTFEEDSRRVVIEIAQPYGNHNGGHLLIDDAGRLLIGMGDGGSADDPDRRSLDPNDLHGKILRIDPVPDPGTGRAYRIPDDNPFAAGGGRPEIVILGVRNPWKFTFDPATGDLWVADVGQSAVEEATRIAPAQIAGASLGWSAFEGDRPFNLDQPASGHLPPTLTYPHGDAGCSISGGAVYRGQMIDGLGGAYVFGDFCSGRVVAADPATGRTVELLRRGPISAVLPGPAGDLYILMYDGEIGRLVGR